jgi:hypothetical protein
VKISCGEVRRDADPAGRASRADGCWGLPRRQRVAEESTLQIRVLDCMLLRETMENLPEDATSGWGESVSAEVSLVGGEVGSGTIRNKQ